LLETTGYANLIKDLTLNAQRLGVLDFERYFARHVAATIEKELCAQLSAQFHIENITPKLFWMHINASSLHVTHGVTVVAFKRYCS